MREIEELERALAGLAATAPDGAGMIELVKADATRIRRRRRLVSISATSAVLVVAMAGIPAAIPGLGQRAPDPTAPVYREPLQLTVDIEPGTDYYKSSHGTTGAIQRLAIRSTDQDPLSPNNLTIKIVVHDPGTYDASHLLMRGERVTVQGHTAYYVTDLPPGAGGTYAVGWQDPAGAWVLVIAEKTPKDRKPTLMRFAELVRITPPRDILAPFSLSYVPAGLKPYNVGIKYGWSPDNEAFIGFGEVDVPWRLLGIDPLMGGDHPLTIRMLPRHSAAVDSASREWGPTMRIAGYDAWYMTRADGSWLGLNHGTCHVSIYVADRDQIPLSELDRMLEGARFADCTDPATWSRPIP